MILSDERLGSLAMDCLGHSYLELSGESLRRLPQRQFIEEAEETGVLQVQVDRLTKVRHRLFHRVAA